MPGGRTSDSGTSERGTSGRRMRPDTIRRGVVSGTAIALLSASSTLGIGTGHADQAARSIPAVGARSATTTSRVTAVAAVAAKPSAPRPRIKQHRIPFSKARKRQMVAYSLRHYGHREWRLHPKVIVEHYTGTNSLGSVFATFASNAADPELREKPGVCTHFVIDRDGTIYQLVDTGIRCRHTVGLNHVALGIEHVGTSDGQVMSNKRQISASIRLTTWLMGRFGVSLGNVIGHNESLRSRFHNERYRSWRCQTHGDFRGSTMRRYRDRLSTVARRHSLDRTGPRWRRGRC